MTQQQKRWIDACLEHVKKNIIPLFGLVGSLLWFLHTADAHWVKLEANQANSIIFQNRADKHFADIDAHLDNLDTLKYQIRDLKNEMNWRFKTDSKDNVFVTEYKDATGKIHFRTIN